MAGKYMPLQIYLRDLPANQEEVSLDFEQIEGILNNKLPASAYEDQRWWEHETEGNHVDQRAWTNVLWEVKSLDVKAQKVIFARSRNISS